MLLKFADEGICVNFLLNHLTWGTWFTSLDSWSGQSFAFERLEWVQVSSEDGNISISWIGVLVREGDRIHEHITLHWKKRQFRVWIEEDISEWVPDCIGEVVIPVEKENAPVNNHGQRK
ncbi:hypothetical protein Hanom_Chr10g00938711 [Helianthus anomalus]